MFIAKYKDPNGKEYCNLYFNPEKFFSDTFSPECDIDFVIEFVVHGKTYKEKKDCVQDIAIQYSNSDLGADIGLSYLELNYIQSWFSVNAYRYGLVNEFKENWII